MVLQRARVFKALVDRGFLKSIPGDPLWAGMAKNNQYYSDGMKNLGVVLVLERAHGGRFHALKGR